MSAPVEAAKSSQDSRPTFVRIKRRKDDSPADEVILEGVGQRKKRSRYDDLALQFYASASVLDSRPATPIDFTAGAIAKKRQRFVRVQTMAIAALEGKTQEEVCQLIGSSASEQTSSHARASTLLPDSTGSGRQAAKAAPSPLHAAKAERRASAQQASRAARYQQIRGKRISMGGDSSPFHLYDLEHQGQTQAEPASATQKPQQQQQERSPAEAELAEHYLPMMEQYFKELGVPVPMDVATAVASSGQRGSKAVASGLTASGATSNESSPDNFVYDVYVAMDEGGEEGMSLEEDSTSIPVIEVADDDDDLYWEGQDERDSHDSEDSNAESYFGNTYPDDGSNSNSDADSADRSAEEAAGGCNGTVRGAGRGRYRTEEDDYSAHSSSMSSGGESDEDSEGRDNRHRRARGLWMH